MISLDPARWSWALGLVASYALLTGAIMRNWRARHGVQPAGAADRLVAYASQTGSAEFLAQQTVATLRTGGQSARSVSIEQLDRESLRANARILFIASTYGEGDPPDSAARFLQRLAGADIDLAHLHYGLLALGDSNYANFCGFGRSLERSLQARGAQPLFARIDVDRGAPPAIEVWRHHLSHLAGTSDAPDWSAPAYAGWRIAGRTLLNPGSAGAPVYQIALVPASGVLPEWQSGDLVQISAPGEPDFPREYSIASLPADGQIELLVRLHLRDDANHGLASGWLCLQAGPQDTVALRVRQHSRFQLGDNAPRPLILIGNGTGMAGLRAHLKSRVAAGTMRNWLVFGERNAAHDYFCQHEIEQWRRDGMLDALSLAFSRDQSTPRYVQHVLAEQADALRAWVAEGAAIYVCGSLQGMAAGVHDALAAVLGQAELEALGDSGRYRRDVY